MKCKVIKKQFLEQLEFFDYDKILKDHFEISGNQLKIKDGKTIRLLSKKESNQTHKDKIRVVIDPGHIGGIHNDLRKIPLSPTLTIQEGNLTLPTSLLIKEILEKNGIEVFLTRETLEPVTQKKSKDFTAIAQKLVSAGKINFKSKMFDLQFSDPVELAKHYLWSRVDLEARAQVINDFNPDFSVSVHYLGSTEEVFTDDNGIAVFILGAFTKEDLPQRLESLAEHILSGNFYESKGLALKIYKNMKKALKLNESDGKHMGQFMRVKEGVIARRLHLLDLVKNPIVLAEGPFQNNEEELEKLLRNDFEISGFPYSQRMKDYAEAVARGVLSHVKETYK